MYQDLVQNKVGTARSGELNAPPIDCYPPPKRVWAHPHRQFEHFLRAPTPMFGPMGKPLKPGSKVAIDVLTYLFF